MIIPQWPAPQNVKALVTEREVFSPEHSARLGQSLPPYESFNLGDHVNDLPRHVSANRQQLVDNAQGCDEIRWLQQVHGIDCLDASLIENGAAVDAAFTRTPALACAVMTADCLPVLFCDLQGRQVAAAHAGWRGLANGILENALKTFSDNGIPLNQIIAWLGPAISQSAFEVGPDVKHAFARFTDGKTWADEMCFIAGSGDRLQADIYRLARLQLEHLGVGGVYGSGGEAENYCTASDITAEGDARFFSYRRQAITGRQASLLWMVE